MIILLHNNVWFITFSMFFPRFGCYQIKTVLWPFSSSSVTKNLVLKVSNQNDIKVCKSPRIKNVAIHSQWLSLFVVHNKTQHYFKKDETTSRPCSTFEKDIDEGHDQDNIRKDTFVHIFCNLKLYMIMKM